MAEDMTELQQEQDVLSRLQQGHTQPPPEEPEEEQEEEQERTIPPPAREGEDVEEEAPEKGTPAPEEQTLTIDPDAELFEITVKGEGGKDETVRMSLSQMQAGVMMQQDYQRKTAELSKARDNLQKEMEEIIAPEREAYIRNLQIMQQTVLAMGSSELQNVDWESLATNDPAKYVQLVAKAQRVQQTIGQMQEMQNAAQQRAWAQQVELSKRALSDPISGIKGWGAEKYQALMREGAQAYGFRPEEVAAVVDHRMIRVLDDALAYRALQKAKPTVEKRVTVAPKVLKPGASADDSQLRAKQEGELYQRLKKSGDVKDAAALWLARQQRR